MPTEHRITWLLVADASRAKVFESSGARKAVHALDDMTLVGDLPKSGELFADRQGARSILSAGADTPSKIRQIRIANASASSPRR